MNGFLIAAGAVASFTTIGHFAIGSKQFLAPMLECTFDAVAKKVMHCVFHYVSAYLILSATALLLIGFGFWSGPGLQPVVRFIAINYTAFAVWQICLAVTSGIEKGVVKLFQWTFFVAIAVLAWIGA